MAISWLLIGVITAYDIYWAITYAHTIMSWEFNPFARVIIENFGLNAIIVLRITTIMFGAVLMPFATRRMQITCTSLALLVHLYLATAYILISEGEP